MYEMKRNVTYSQVGSGLTMDMAGVVHFLQDCTLAHSESVGKDSCGFRMRIRWKL